MADAEAIEVREARPAELCAGTELLAGALGFAARDAVPAWLAQDAQEAGGLALVALAGEELAGFSLALPACDGAERSYFSCGLAVQDRLRSRGVGRRLKLAQRALALERGAALIRWRADPLNAAGLRLYLDGLGARLVGYRAELYAGVRADGDVPHDDVEIEWRLREAPARGARGPLVELPWDAAELDPGAARHWRLAVRGEVRAVLAAGAVGAGVERDAAARRAWLRFEAP